MAHSFTCTTTDGHSGPFPIPTDLLIGDAWVPAVSGGRIDILNPATEGVLTSVADASPAEGIAAVDAAAAAQWVATAPRKRADILLTCFHAMMAEQEWLAQLIALENGKALSDARGEVAYAAEFFRWYAEEAVRIQGEISVSPSGANRILVQYQPIAASRS